MGDPELGQRELLRLLHDLIKSNLVLADEVRQLREAIQKVGGGNMLAGFAKLLRGK